MSIATVCNKELVEAVRTMLSGSHEPDLALAAREEMDRMREETRQRIGTVEVAVDLIRDARDS